MLSVLDRVVDPLTATLSARVKSDAVRQEVDRNEDMIRSCLRSVESLDRLDGSQDVGSFRSFMDTVILGGNIKDKYEMIKKERKQVDNL
jgi:cullin-associated NEDD8-dissociated protein 1